MIYLAGHILIILVVAALVGAVMGAWWKGLGFEKERAGLVDQLTKARRKTEKLSPPAPAGGAGASTEAGDEESSTAAAGASVAPPPLPPMPPLPGSTEDALAEAKARVAELEGLLETAGENDQASAARIEELEARVAELEAELAKTKAAMEEALNAAEAEAQVKVAERTGRRVPSHTAQLVSERAGHKKAKRQIDALTAELEAARAEIATLKG